eukprot:1362720-Amphidinium_carterae.2
MTSWTSLRPPVIYDTHQPFVVCAPGGKDIRLLASHSSDVKAGHMLLLARTGVSFNGYATLAMMPESRCVRKRQAEPAMNRAAKRTS